MTVPSGAPADREALTRSLAGPLFAILIAFLVTGASLATLPIYITDRLGYGPDVVGAVAGVQFLSSLGSRFFSGRLSDRRGPKVTLLAGLALIAAAGLAYLVAVAWEAQPILAVLGLFAGRVLMGAGEGFVITAGQSWGLALAGPARSALVIGWAGTALYVGLAAGGPAGALLRDLGGFVVVALLTIGLPALALPSIARRPNIRTPGGTTTAGTREVLAAVFAPGLAMCLSGFVFTAMSFFSVLFAVERGWTLTWAPFTAFALALVLTRVVAGGLPDRLGGYRTAQACQIATTLGLVGMAASPTATVAVLSAFVCGASYAFIFPGLGREAIRRAPPGRNGTAVALYSACVDLSIAVASPLLGLLAAERGLAAVFWASAGAGLGALAVVSFLRRGSAGPR